MWIDNNQASMFIEVQEEENVRPKIAINIPVTKYKYQNLFIV